MGIEALKQQLKEGKITKEQFATEAKKLLDAKTITQEEHDAAIKDVEGSNGGGSGTLTAEQVATMIAEAVAKAEQSSGDKVRTEYAAKLKKEQDEKDKLLKEKMSADELQKFELDKAKKELEDGKRELLKGQVALYTVDTLTAKELPLSFKTFLARETQEETTKAIDEFAAEWQKALSVEVDKRFKKGGQDPPGGKGGAGGEINPFDPKTLNLTEQGRIFKADPDKARALAKEAGVKLLF